MSKCQEHEDIERAVSAINYLYGEIPTSGGEGLKSLLLALSVRGGNLRDAAVDWYAALNGDPEREG